MTKLQEALAAINTSDCDRGGDLINNKELRELAAKLQSLCEDPGGIGDHVIAQHAAVRATLLPLFEENCELQARIESLEGGIVAENARVVKEHNELRAARDAAEVAFARFAHEVADALGGPSNEGTLDRIRALAGKKVE